MGYLWSRPSMAIIFWSRQRISRQPSWRSSGEATSWTPRLLAFLSRIKRARLNHTSLSKRVHPSTSSGRTDFKYQPSGSIEIARGIGISVRKTSPSVPTSVAGIAGSCMNRHSPGRNRWKPMNTPLPGSPCRRSPFDAVCRPMTFSTRQGRARQSPFGERLANALFLSFTVRLCGSLRYE